MAQPDIPPAAVTNAAVAIYQVLERAVVAVSGPGDADVRLRQIASEAAGEALAASAPLIAAAERERIAAIIEPARLRQLADWFDTDDRFKATMFPETWPERGHEVQDDLRAWADLLGGDQPEPETDDVHVDWHMTHAEWAELSAVLLASGDRSPYIRALRDAGKLAGPAGLLGGDQP